MTGALEPMALIAIFGMAVATFITRASGIWLMGYVTFSPRIERFLRHMASGVLMSIVVAALAKGDASMWLALPVACAVMLIFKRQMAAMLLGVVVTALLRYLGVS